MSKELIVSAGRHETRVAILEDDQVVELFHEREKEYSLAGSIHKGRVTRVLPGMQSAFVDIGLDRDAFLYVSDFFEDNEEYDAVVSTVEEKVLKMERGGGAGSLQSISCRPPLARNLQMGRPQAGRRRRLPRLCRLRFPLPGLIMRATSRGRMEAGTAGEIAAGADAVDAAVAEDAAVVCRIRSSFRRRLKWPALLKR